MECNVSGINRGRHGFVDNAGDLELEQRTQRALVQAFMYTVVTLD